MAKIAFENFRAQAQGASFQDQSQLIKGNPASGFFGESIIDPNRIPGVLSPIPIGTALTNASTIDTKVTKMINYINDVGKIYAIGVEKLYEIDSGSNTVNLTSPYPHTISGGGTTETASDIIVYENNGTSEIFYSWNDSVSGDIGRLSSVQSLDAFDDDYFTAVVGGAALDKDYPHPMAIGDNNICYIGNGSVLASMDLRTGSPVATDIEIDVLGGWIIKDHISYKGFHWIAARETHSGSNPDPRQIGRSAVFVWDYVKDNFDEIYYIEDNDIFNIFIHSGKLHITTSYGRSSSKIRVFNGFTFIPTMLYEPSSSGDQVTLGGVSERQGMIMWGSNANGKLYTLGSPNRQGSNDFNIIGDIGGSCSAIIQQPFHNDIYYIADGTPQVQRYIFAASGGFNGLSSSMQSLRHDFGSSVSIKEFRVYFPDLTGLGGNGDANEKLQLDGYFNGSSSNTVLGTIGSDKHDVGYAKIPYNKSDVYSINVGFRYGSDIAAGDPTILPYKIEVIYDDTNKR